MSFRLYSASALVLHRINLSEHDKIVTLFTEERGKLNAVAKGARKPVSKLAGSTELFTHSRMQLAVGRSLDVITQTEIVDSFHGIRADLERIAYAAVVTELLDRFTEERDPNPGIFTLTLASLRGLQRGGALDLRLRLYQLHLLAAVGYQPHLDDCVVDHEALAQGPLAFSPALGGVLCAAHRRRQADAIAVQPDTVKLARALQHLGPDDDAALATLDQHAPMLLRRELDRLLRAHIQFRLERPIHSLDFVREVQAVYE